MLARFTQSAIAALLSVSGATAAHAGFLPPNDLHLQDNIYNRAANVTEAQFNEAIDEAEAFYGPLIKEKLGANFKVNRRWSDSTVNASATQSFGTFVVNMYGGLARRSETTRDGFALVLCHEIGHHLGGYPFSSSWAADEGQSDYFSTISCARDLWGNQKELNATFRETVDAYPKGLCDKAWSTEDEQNLCYRSMMGGKSLAALLSALGGTKANWTTPATNVVSSTNHSHPAGQCRLDTYIAGALCPQEFDPSARPGVDLGSKRNSVTAEEASAKYTCLRRDFKVGTRPTCWFKPLI